MTSSKRIKFASFVVFLLGTAGHAFAATPNSNQVANGGLFAFVDVTVVPMDGERIVQGQTVVVRNGRIDAMGAAKSVRVPKDAVTIDGRGRYLMPGLVDMHVHLEYFDRDPQLMVFLAGGVTTVRNMDGRENILAWRKRAAEGSLLAPTIFTAGPILEGNPPARDDNLVVETPAQAKAAVEQQKRDGYDFIKVLHTLNAETY
jgi:hypothetical protein